MYSRITVRMVQNDLPKAKRRLVNFHKKRGRNAKINMEMRSYWRNNVYRPPYFSARREMGKAVSHKLANSLSVYKSGNTWNAEVKHYNRRGHDVINILIYGTEPSKGSYVPQYDARVKKGMHGGCRNNPGVWIRWTDRFTKEMINIIKREYDQELQRISREV